MSLRKELQKTITEMRISYYSNGAWQDLKIAGKHGDINTIKKLRDRAQERASKAERLRTRLNWQQ